jgi:SAM-dependent methyltransferase
MLMHKGKVLDTVKEYEIIKCDHCGFIHVNPIPSEGALGHLYREQYYTLEKPQFIDRQLEDLEWWHVVYNERYDFLEKHLPAERRRMLDIGCGPGFFLQRGIERGWNCLGIEPSRQASEYAKGLGVEVLNCFLHKAGFEEREQQFDVIHLSEVLEHIPDPLSLCKSAYTLLDKGGILCVVVPNDYNPVQKLLKEQLGFPPYWIGPPHHINYFTFESLKRLLKRIGFNILYTTATFPMEFFLIMGDNYVGNDRLGRACHAKRKRLDIVLNDPALQRFKKDMYRLMAKYSIGREIVIYGVK